MPLSVSFLVSGTDLTVPRYHNAHIPLRAGVKPTFRETIRGFMVHLRK